MPTFGEYGVEVSSEGISVGELTKVTEDRTTRAKLLPSTEMLGDSALITFKITGEDRLGSGFRITKTQSISRVTPGKDGENAKAPKIIDGY